MTFPFYIASKNTDEKCVIIIFRWDAEENKFSPVNEGESHHEIQDFNTIIKITKIEDVWTNPK